MKIRIKAEPVFSDFVRAIQSGEFDSQLNTLGEITHARRQYLRTVETHEKRLDLKVGDRVRFIAKCRPRYLAFTEGKITGFRGDRALVVLDRPAGRFAGEVRAPLSIIEKV